jgi:hypothetical protein
LEWEEETAWLTSFVGGDAGFHAWQFFSVIIGDIHTSCFAVWQLGTEPIEREA